LRLPETAASFFMSVLRILIVLIFLNPCPAFAQPGYGPEIGIGLSSMHFAPAAGFTSASGSPIASGRIGGIADFGLNRHFYLQAGLFLSRKGQTRDFSFYTNDSLNESVHQTLTINYLDIPVNLFYKTGFQGKGRFFFGLGVTPSYIIGGENKFQAKGVSAGTPFVINHDSKIVAGNPVAMFDIGMNLSAGYELATGLFFRAYYTSGVKDIGLGGEVDKNRMWGISAGYIFGKGRNINKEADELIDKTTNQ
jgi:hypothetical protein